MTWNSAADKKLTGKEKKVRGMIGQYIIICISIVIIKNIFG